MSGYNFNFLPPRWLCKLIAVIIATGFISLLVMIVKGVLWVVQHVKFI
jgi:hypothetical protein